MPKGKLSIIVGLARSGKSTFCNRLLQNSLYKCKSPLSSPPVIICADDFRLALHGQRYISEAEETVFAMTHVATKAILLRGFDVLVDETNTRMESIEKWLKIDPNLDIYYINTSLEICKERAISTNQESLLKPLERMHDNLIKTYPWLMENYSFTKENNTVSYGVKK